MPVSYQFTDRKTGLNPSLATVDAEVCEFDGHTLSETRYSQGFQAIETLCIAALMMVGGSEITREEHEGKLVELCRGKDTAEWRVIEEFVFNRYSFRAWR